MTDAQAQEIETALSTKPRGNKSAEHSWNMLHVERELPGELGSLIVWGRGWSEDVPIQLSQDYEATVTLFTSMDPMELARVASLLIAFLEGIAR